MKRLTIDTLNPSAAAPDRNQRGWEVVLLIPVLLAVVLVSTFLLPLIVDLVTDGIGSMI